MRVESVEARRPKYEFLAKREAREGLKGRALELIEQIENEGVDTLIFLDRSARPLSWLMREMWKEREVDAPEMKFLNIGHTTRVSSGGHDILVPPNATDEERSRYIPLRESTNNKIREGEWLSAEDLPRSWVDGLLENADILAQLEELFGNHLKSRNVLVVDELVSSGTSVLTAIGSLSLACPNVKNIRGTGFYQGAGTGIAEDRKRIPWLRVPGMAGVLEIPDKLFLSAAITPENVDMIQEKIKQVFEEEFSEAAKDFVTLLDGLNRFADFLSQKDSRSDSVSGRDKECFDHIVPRLIERLETAIDSHGIVEPEGFQRDLYEVSYVFGGLGELEEFRRIDSVIYEIAHLSDKYEYQESVGWLFAMQEQASVDYDGVRVLKSRSRKLREEIIQLAQE